MIAITTRMALITSEGPEQPVRFQEVPAADFEATMLQYGQRTSRSSSASFRQW